MSSQWGGHKANVQAAVQRREREEALFGLYIVACVVSLVVSDEKSRREMEMATWFQAKERMGWVPAATVATLCRFHASPPAALPVLYRSRYPLPPAPHHHRRTRKEKKRKRQRKRDLASTSERSVKETSPAVMK